MLAPKSRVLSASGISFDDSCTKVVLPPPIKNELPALILPCEDTESIITPAPNVAVPVELKVYAVPSTLFIN